MRKRITELGLIMICAIVCCGLLTFYSLRFQVGKLGTYTVEPEHVKKIQAMLEECTPGNYGQDLVRFYVKYDDLREYGEVLQQTSSENPSREFRQKYSTEEIERILGKYSYSSSQAYEMMQLVSICEDRISFAMDYKKYLDRVRKNVNDMLNVKLFSEKNRNSILKLNRDFYGMENVEISACVNVGLEKLMDAQVGNITALICVILCAWIYAMGCRENAAAGIFKTGGFAGFALLLLTGIAGIYVAEMYVVDRVWLLEDLSRSVQSVERFRSCPWILSVGMLLGVRVLFKCLAMTVIFLICVGLFTMERRMRILWMVAGIAGLEIILKMLKMPYLFQGMMQSETVFGKYGNVLIFGNPVTSAWLLILVSVAVLIMAVFFSEMQQRGFQLKIRAEAEQKYFEEVDERYTETRMLRHDMNNHFSALAILLKENRTGDAMEYLQHVMDYFETTKPPVRTGVGVLDAVLLGKVNGARERGIKVELDFRENFAHCRMQDFELCSVFGNLLDNAVTACEKLPEEKRWIRLQVSRQLEMLCIFCENPCLSVQKENGRFITQKADSKNHGMGIRQMERIASKYDGTVEIQVQDGEFKVSVLLCDQ